MRYVLSQDNISIPNYSYPDELEKYKGRSIRTVKIEDLKNEKMPIFIKPVEAKDAANGDVWSNINNNPKIFTQAIRVGYDPAYIMEKFRYSNIDRMGKNFTIHEDNHGIEKAGGIEFINNMLVQSSDGILKVFPNWTGRDARLCHLREKGAYLISSEMSDGKVK